MVDTEFTDTGVMTIDFFGFSDVAESVAVMDDGKIVVAGKAAAPGGVRSGPAGPSDGEAPDA